MTSLGIMAGAIVGSLGTVYAVGPVGWVVGHFVALSLLMVVLIRRDSTRA